MRRLHFAVLVVGAGPAGLAAACAAAEAGAAAVGLVDAEPAPGGQVWRGGQEGPVAAWVARARRAGVRLLPGTAVLAPTSPTALLAEDGEGALLLSADRLVLAPGARERFLPFPGWTLPGVTGAGGLQALVRGGLGVAGARVVVAGSGPLLLAAAAELLARGAEVLAICEQTGLPSLAGLLPALLADGARLGQAAELAWALRGVDLRAGCHVACAHGHERLDAVTLRQGSREWRLPCNRLACAFGLVPNLELPMALGCALAGEAVRVDAWQATSVPGVYCAGEVAGIAGLPAALAEGTIAGLAAAGRPERARPHFAARSRARRFGRALERAFAPRGALRGLPAADTIVCRCEDVTHAELAARSDWREARLQSRCGMGPCQGRVCGPAAAFLYGWTVGPPRPPLRPAAVGTLAALAGGPRAAEGDGL